MGTQLVGRFAPSPTGELHLGSLITAIASFCLAKKSGGHWLVRIEDVDSERCRSEFSSQILYDLERLGLYWDGDVRYQSKQLDMYHDYLDNQLLSLSYGCDCSRKSIAQYLQHHQLTSHRYPQLCYQCKLPRHHAIRLIMPNQTLVFYDKLQGIIVGNPQLDNGDIVLRRRAMSHAKGMINYMLAVVVDDAIQGVNQVVRGLDILPLTIPQLVIADYLKLPFISEYYHLPILVNEHGQKLSKQTFAEPIAPYSPQQLLQIALFLLQQPPVTTDHPTVMLAQAIEQWDSQQLFQQKSITIPPLATLISKFS